MAKWKWLCLPPMLAIGLLALFLAGAKWPGGGFLVANAQGTLRYVSPTGLDSGDCSASASPCQTIQYAVDQAASGDEVRIAAGTYTGLNNLGGLAQIVYIDQPITLRGGFTPSNWTTPDPAANPTTLDAEKQGRVMSIIGAEGVTIAGLRLTNGLANNMGGLYMGHYTCNGTGRGAGGGVCIQEASVSLDNLWVITNTASSSGGYGGGVFATSAVLTLTHSTIQGNQAGAGLSHAYGGGVALAGGAARVENNLLTNNAASPSYDGDGGGIFALDTHALIQANTLRENEVRGDPASAANLGGGAIAVRGGGVTISHNQIVANHAPGYLGGGLSWTGGPITVTANLLLDNTAGSGGAIFAGNSVATVNNNVMAGNTASSHGSALYINTYSPNTASLRHNTISRNSGGGGAGGDDVAVYVSDYGRAAFYNTILAENVVGIGMGWSTSISFERTLWDSNITDTVGYIDEVGHLDGSAAFAADGYHLTEASDAVDAGMDAGLSSDIDDEPRPQGNAPDIGADESPYGQGAGSGSVGVDYQALPARLMLTTHDNNGAPRYLIQQEYLLQVANGLTETALSHYAITDWLPTELDYAAQLQYPPMTFNRLGNTLTWEALAPLPPESLAWVSMVGNALPEDGGQVITNAARVDYTLSGGGVYHEDVQAASLIPNFPPFISFPENGEYCLDGEGNLDLQGLAKPGAELEIYADGSLVAQATASITGTFQASFQPVSWLQGTPVALSSRDCTNGACGDLSNIVSVRPPAGGWCPQRSVWYGTIGSNTYRWPFRDENGQMSTQNWQIPGARGFWNTTLKIYECQPPDAGYSVSSIVVEADGSLYEDSDGAPDANGGWSFSIQYAHSVSVMVSAENSIGATKVYVSHGSILIDPDGYVFDVTQGLEVTNSTPEGAPVEVDHTLQGITVTCMVSMPTWGGWVPWPAYLYEDQINPQVTGQDGYFAFFTPPGAYYLQVEGGPNYQSWRSPVVQVITDIVHVNVPLTPRLVAGEIYPVELEQAGPDPAVVTIPAGAIVEWRWQPDAQVGLATLADWLANPFFQPRSGGLLDPLNNILGFDGGRLVPGQAYRRQFDLPGTYAYTDGAGHAGQVMVTGSYAIYLPVLKK